MSTLLAIDVGGTHLRAVLLEENEAVEKIKIRHSPFSSFEEWFNQSVFKKEKLNKVIIAAAGPCDGESLPMTHLNWQFEKKKLENFFGCSVTLLNDLEAAVYLLPSLELPGLPKGGVKGLVMPGTGLGEGFIVPWNEEWLPVPTEGGHTFFAPKTERQKKIAEKLGPFPLEIETILSGSGLQRLHHSLTGEKLSPEEVVEQNGEAVDLFAEILIDEAANFALRTLPRGGLFIGGSIVQAISPVVAEHSKRFVEHPKMSHVLKEIPLAILKDDDVVLQGAVLIGRQAR